jgi:hypothetical protein
VLYFIVIDYCEFLLYEVIYLMFELLLRKYNYCFPSSDSVMVSYLLILFISVITFNYFLFFLIYVIFIFISLGASYVGFYSACL